MSAALVACSHGTNDLGGRQAISSILADVRAHRPDLAVHETYVDVQQPQIAEVLAAVLPDSPVVVVPMLLSGRHHVKVDIAASYLLAPGFFYDRLLEAGADVVTAPLAPHPALAQIVLDRFDAMQGGRARRLRPTHLFVQRSPIIAPPRIQLGK